MEPSISESSMLAELSALATLLNSASLRAPARSSSAHVDDLLRFRGGSKAQLVLKADQTGRYNVGVDLKDTVDDTGGEFHGLVNSDGWEAELDKQYPGLAYGGFTPSSSYKFNEAGVKIKAQVDGKLTDEVSAQYAIGNKNHAKKYSADDLVHSGKLGFSLFGGKDKLDLLASYSQGSKAFKPSMKYISNRKAADQLTLLLDPNRAEIVGRLAEGVKLKYGMETGSKDIGLTVTNKGNKYGGKLNVIDSKPHVSLDAEVVQKGTKFTGKADFRDGIRKPRLSLSTSIPL
jgi:hypothetical protein